MIRHDFGELEIWTATILRPLLRKHARPTMLTTTIRDVCLTSDNSASGVMEYIYAAWICAPCSRFQTSTALTMAIGAEAFNADPTNALQASSSYLSTALFVSSTSKPCCCLSMISTVNMISTIASCFEIVAFKVFRGAELGRD